MAMFIFLTAEQADLVRGPSTIKSYSSLNPIERQDGVFILGINVLDDITHQEHWEYLNTLPQLDDNDPSFPLPIESILE